MYIIKPLCLVFALLSIFTIGCTSTKTNQRVAASIGEESYKSYRGGGYNIIEVSEKLGLDLSSLSDHDLSKLASTYAQFKKEANQVAVAANGNPQIKKHTDYFCVGGKAAVFVIGIQGLKCTDADLNVISVGFNNQNYATAITGLAANDYVGVNGGIGIFIGGLRHTCKNSDDCSIESGYKADKKGGMINGAFLWYGALVGYYSNDESSVFIGAWQGGISAELSVSSIQIDKQ